MSKVVHVVWMMQHSVVVDTLGDDKAEDLAIAAMEQGFALLQEHDPTGPQYIADSLRVMDVTTSH